MNNNLTILQFIRLLRKSDFYIEDIYLMGGCYQFHLILAKLFPGCECYINSKCDHIVTKYGGNFYDIRGMVEPDRGDSFHPIDPVSLKKAKKWSFRGNCLLMLTECEHCEEPYIYYRK